MFGNSNLLNLGYDPANRVAFDNARDTGAVVTVNGKKYAVYKTAAGNYYYNQAATGSGTTLGDLLPNRTNAVFLDPNNKKDAAIIKDIESQIEAGAKRTYSNTEINGIKTMTNANPVVPASKTPTALNERNEKTETTKQESTGAGVDLSPITKAINDLAKRLADSEEARRKFMEEYFKRPEKLGADYWANKLGVDYNYDNILRDYNQKTNDYYDSLIAENEDLRNRYNRNNYNYLDNTINAYLNSYKQAAPTATNNKAKAATALANTMYGADYNRDNDYTALQNSNYLEQERRAELAMNPYTAVQQYNDLGTYLGNLEGTINVEKTKQYVNALDAYAQKYAASRAASSILYNANAAKYKGLADAAGTMASGAANNYNNSSKINSLYDFYTGLMGGNRTLGATATWNNVRSGAGNLPTTYNN